MELNWLFIGVVLLFFICVLTGFRRGFVKLAVGLASTVLSIVLVSALFTHVSSALCAHTQIDDSINKTVREQLDERVQSTLPGAGIDTDQDLEKLGEQMTEQLTRQQQNELVDGAEVPAFLKAALKENNNTEIYSLLGVDTFVDYVAAYITRLIMNVVSYLATLLLVIIIVKVTIFALDIMAKLPGLHGINKLFGGIFGVLQGLVIVWVVFVVLTMIWETELGKLGFHYIDGSQTLTWLYNQNPLLKVVMSFTR